ncbi:MAG TPA: LysR family transcriptional regulator [Ktedonobacterales bacterium]
MTLEQIETFVAVSRARSFSRAALLLNLAQPTLSGRIAALERELGAPVFARRGHTLELTDAGRALIPYAERMLTLKLEGQNAAKRAARGDMGQLTLGANPSCSQYIAPRLVERYLQDHANDRAKVYTQLSPVLMETLMDGVIELALCSTARAEPRATIHWTYSAPLLLLAAASHPLARQGSCERADLARHTILSTQAGPTQWGLRSILPVGVEARVEATAGEVMRKLLLRGVGVTVLPEIAVWNELRSGELSRVTLRDVQLPAYDIALVSWPRSELSPAAEALLRIVADIDVRSLLDDDLERSSQVRDRLRKR